MPVLFRLLAGAPLALLAALLLFLAMRGLIAAGDVPLEERREPPVIDINPQVPERERPQRVTEPEPVILAPPPVDRLPTPSADVQGRGEAALQWRLPSIEPPDLGTHISFTVTDRDAQPTMRFPGAYPPAAQQRGLEGECLMQFDVGPDGAPFNIRALDCSSGLFAAPSIRAVERWRYAPKILDGAPVARTGVQTTLDYRLAD
jgi:protein TonB